MTSATIHPDAAFLPPPIALEPPVPCLDSTGWDEVGEDMRPVATVAALSMLMVGGLLACALLAA